MKRPKGKALYFTCAILAGSAIMAFAIKREPRASQYRTLPVIRGDLDSTISASGTPNAVVTVDVGSQVSGNISALYADFNTRVRKDQVVARIDPQIFQARADQARAALDSAGLAVASARANVEKSQADVASAQANVAAARENTAKARYAVADAKSKLARRIQLANEGVLSAEDRETAQATYDQAAAGVDAAQAQERAAQSGVAAAEAQLNAARTLQASAEAQVKQAAAALQQARIDLERTYIRAPVDGTVVSRSVNVGQTVAASLAAPTLFQIAQDLTRMQVDTNVDEADIGRVRTGQAATFTVDAWPARVFKGVVSQIRQAPINTQNVITYDAVIAVANPDLKLFPGMTANVRIIADQRRDVLKIPNASLRFRPRPKTQTVWFPGTDEKPRPVAIRTGISDGKYTEVTGGDLREGDQVIVGTFTRESPAAGARRPRGPAF